MPFEVTQAFRCSDNVSLPYSEVLTAGTEYVVTLLTPGWFWNDAGENRDSAGIFGLEW